jgi:hypothetical protein
MRGQAATLSGGAPKPFQGMASREAVMEGEGDLADEIHVFYCEDSEGNPLISVINVAKMRQRTVDAVKSLEQDPSNIGHPLIVALIVECTDAIRFRREERDSPQIELFYPYTQSAEKGKHPDEDLATRWLSSISAALVSGARKRRKEDDAYRAAKKALGEFTDTYFEHLWALLDSPTIRDMSASEKIERVSEWQKERAHGDVEDWLEQDIIGFVTELFSPSDKFANNPLELPKRGKGKALRNLFFCWKNEFSSVQEGKNIISAARKYMGKLMDDDTHPQYAAVWDILNKADADKFVERDLGINIVSPTVEEDLSTSGLVVIECPLEVDTH